MKKPVLAANWKMHHGPSAAREFMREFLDRYPRNNDRTIIFFPSAVAITAVAEQVGSRSDILVGVQNIHTADNGAFTGETSAVMARDAGARVALVGHSERRHVFGEADAECAEKVAAAERAGLTPMLCVGETLEQRDAGSAESVVVQQLETGISKLARNANSKLLLAYEPVWAIGTGRNATPADASAIHAVLRAKLKELLGEGGGRVPILYGGSVNAGNAGPLLAADGVDGLLVGGASLDAGSWLTIARSVSA
jgi:triosephosphate isomerase (TIM)